MQRLKDDLEKKTPQIKGVMSRKDASLEDRLRELSDAWMEVQEVAQIRLKLFTEAVKHWKELQGKIRVRIRVWVRL